MIVSPDSVAGESDSCFQFFNLLPTLTVMENVALPLLLEGAMIQTQMTGAETSPSV